MFDAKTEKVLNESRHSYDDKRRVDSGYDRYEMGEEVVIGEITLHVGDLIEYDGDRGWISNLKQDGDACFTQCNPWLAPPGHYSHGRFITNPEDVKLLDSPSFHVTDEEMQETLASIASVQTASVQTER